MRRLLLVVISVGLVALAGLGLMRALEGPRATPEAQVATIGAGLRCPTCQGLSVADSPSKVATSMREIIAEQLAAGRSPEEVRDYFVARYGDWILLSPPTDGFGWLVWLLPVAGVVGGLGAAFAAAGRRRRHPALSGEALEQARAAAESWRQGRLALSDTPAGERLEAAFELVAWLREDDPARTADEESYDVALRALVRALAAQRGEARAFQAAQQRTGVPGAAAGGRTVLSLPGSARRWAWTGGTATFALLLTGLLIYNLAPRGVGDLPTGNLPDRPVQEEQPSEVIAELRTAVEQNPDDTQARLQLAAQLLRQPGGVDEARGHAEAVLERTGGEQPDALLLLGLTQLAQGDPAGRPTLERYLSAAPDGHPGIDVARSLLDDEQ